MTEWFRRFGDVPGIVFSSRAQIDRSSLMGCDDIPEVHTFRFDGQPKETLEWPAGMVTAAAGRRQPTTVHSHPSPRRERLLRQHLLLNLCEGLELPGEAPNYHFLIRRTADELWRRRRKEPDLLREVERLCWLDIGFVEASPRQPAA